MRRITPKIEKGDKSMDLKEVAKLTPEEIVELLIQNLSDCNTLVALLGKKSELDPADLRKLRNELMFTRTKARNLSKILEEMKKPVNAFKIVS